MIIIIGLFGFLSCLASFVSSIILFVLGDFWSGIATLLTGIYCMAVTVVLIRTDGKATDAENKIKQLENQITAIKEQLRLVDKPETAEADEVEEAIKNEIAKITEDEIDLSTGITFCKECGYQLFPEDTICPNCKTKIEK